MEPISMTLNVLWPGFQGPCIFRNQIKNRAR